MSATIFGANCSTIAAAAAAVGLTDDASPIVNSYMLQLDGPFLHTAAAESATAGHYKRPARFAITAAAAAVVVSTVSWGSTAWQRASSSRTFAVLDAGCRQQQLLLFLQALLLPPLWLLRRSQRRRAALSCVCYYCCLLLFMLLWCGQCASACELLVAVARHTQLSQLRQVLQQHGLLLQESLLQLQSICCCSCCSWQRC
jgi:hypothetical protein